ncbi:MAG: hypothetical protein GX442_14805 [Candidatus Riflebacteria bacterium]|nr:hypothetical protein [Candidatus Riflebacteria bacterium]
MNRRTPLATLVLAALLTLAAPAHARWQEFDYTGRGLHHALADIARRGGFNIVTDLPDTKIAWASARSAEGELDPEPWFWQEFLNELGIVCSFRVLGNHDLFVLVPDARAAAWQGNRTIWPSPQHLPRPALAALLPRLTFGALRTWADPDGEALFLGGPPDEVSLMRMTVETIDTPVWSTLCRFRLTDGAGTVLASAAVRTMNHRPFRLSWTPAASGSWAWDAAATPRVDDDGETALAPFRLTLRDPQGATVTLEETLAARDGADGTRELWLAGRPLTLTWRLTIETPGRAFLPVPAAPAAVAGDDDPTGEGAPAEAETETLDGDPLRLVQSESSFPALVDRFAAEDDLEVICDDQASGTVSLFLFGPRPAPADLIRAMASAKGLATFGEGRRLVVAPVPVVRDLRAGDRAPLALPLGARPAPAHVTRVAGLANDLFRAMGLSGKAEPAGAGLRVTGENTARRAARALVEALDEAARPVPVGFRLESAFGPFRQDGGCTTATPLQKGTTTPSGTLLVRLAPAAARDPDTGLEAIEWQLEGRSAGRGLLQARAVSRVPLADQPLVTIDGEPALRLWLTGQHLPPPDPAADQPTGLIPGDPSPAAFDSEF